MENSRVIQFFEVLSPAEKERFGRWLAVESNGKLPKVEALWRALGSKQSKEQIWQDLFPKTQFDDNKFRKISQQLTALLEEFLSILAFRKSDLIKDRLLIQSLSQRKNSELFLKTWNKVNKRLDKPGPRDDQYFLAKHTIASEKLGHLSLIGETKNLRSSLSKLLNDLNKKIAYEKLDTLLLKSGPLQIPLDSFDQHFLTILEDAQNNGQEPPISTMFKVYQLITESQDHDPFQVIQEIRSNKEVFAESMYITLYNAMFNYFVKKANLSGEIDYYRQVLELYQWGTSEELIFLKGYLPYNHYYGLVSTAIKCEQLEIATENLIRYKDKLQEPEKEIGYAYCKALIHFYKKEFKEALSILRTRPYVLLRDEVNGRILALEIRYELREREELEIPIKSYIMFLKSNKVLNESQKLRFINRARLLLALVMANNEKRLLEIQSKIQETHPLINKEWLIEKVKAALSNPFPIHT